MSAGEYRLDNVGREKGKPDRTTDIGPVASDPLGKLTHRAHLTIAELLVPRMRAGNGTNQLGIRGNRAAAACASSKPHLPPNP